MLWDRRAPGKWIVLSWISAVAALMSGRFMRKDFAGLVWDVGLGAERILENIQASDKAERLADEESYKI
jgi:hypothetical protein